MLNSLKIRCSNIVNRNEKTKRCEAFLLEMNDYEVRVRCPKCGTLFVATRRNDGKIDVKGFPKGKPIIEHKCED